jgi:predicted GNAT family acetyltransferase
VARCAPPVLDRALKERGIARELAERRVAEARRGGSKLALRESDCAERREDF